MERIYPKMFTFAILIWFSTTSAVHGGETLDEQVASNPFIRTLVERLSVLEAKDWKQQQAINNLNAKVDNQMKEIVELRSILAKKTCQDKEPSSSGAFQDKDSEVKSTVGKSENESIIKRTSDRISRIRRIENEVTVAFSAGLTHHIQHAGENQAITFDLVETNLGNGYNPHVGVFTAPVAGTYFFTTSIMTTSGRKICEMVVNGVRKAQVYTHGDGHYDHGTQSIVARLKQGDDVTVQIVEHNYDNTIYGEGVPFTTFSGFLLQQDYPGTIVGR